MEPFRLHNCVVGTCTKIPFCHGDPLVPFPITFLPGRDEQTQCTACTACRPVREP